MKNPMIMLLAAVLPVSLQAQRIIEPTLDSWKHPNHSVETFQDWVITGFTDVEPNSNLYMPSFKIADVNGNGINMFYTDLGLGTDIRLMDFTINENGQSIVLAGYTLGFPYELVLAEVDFNGVQVQVSVHGNANGFGIIPHQVICSANAQQVAVVGSYVQSALTVANAATVPKTAFVLGADLNNFGVLQFDREVDTPQGGFSDNDIYENLTETPIGYFISGSANDPSSSKQLMMVLGIDYVGNQLYSSIWDNSNSRYAGASVLCSSSSNIVYLLANNSVGHQFDIGMFNPYTGVLIGGVMHRQQFTSLPIGSGTDQNGFRLQESNGGEIIIAGYFTSWSGTLSTLITPFQMIVDADLSALSSFRLFQSNNNFDPGGYFSMIGNSVYINTPDMFVYNQNSGKTFLVNPNSDMGGFDTYISNPDRYSACEYPLQTTHYTFPATFVSPVNAIPGALYSYYANENPIARQIQQQPLCAAKNLQAGVVSGALLSPNPSSDRMNIALENEEQIAAICIVDLNGMLVGSFSPATGSQAAIDVSQLSTGTYLINITDANGNVHRDKFVKE